MWAFDCTVVWMRYNFFWDVILCQGVYLVLDIFWNLCTVSKCQEPNTQWHSISSEKYWWLKWDVSFSKRTFDKSIGFIYFLYILIYCKDIEKFVDILWNYSAQPLNIRGTEKVWMESCICQFVFGPSADFYVCTLTLNCVSERPLLEKYFMSWKLQHCWIGHHLFW